MSSYSVKKTPGDTAWFRHDRFGMFIHFGLYALPARHEWIKTRELISEEKYDRYFTHFNPDLFCPQEWAKQAKAAGMKYAILTTKHHEGFCLFDSAYTDYKVTNTPFGRDLVREFVDAFRAEGIRVGFYYSLIDWHHPHFPIDRLHPRRHDANAEELDRGRDMKIYCEYMRNQVTELLTNYGKIDILWFDFSYTTPDYPFAPGEDCKPWMQYNGCKGKDEWEAEALIATARALQPDIMIDNRTQLEQDVWTPEQFQPTEWPRHKETGELVTWEACQTMSGSWGYYRDEMTWKSPEILLNLLVDTVSLGGNLLMNVGPTARGYLDRRAEGALATYATWMKYNGRSIYGCTMAEPEWKAPEGTRLTQSEDGKRLYIHLKSYPFLSLMMRGLAKRIEYAQFLHDGSEILYTTGRAADGCGDGSGFTEDAEAVFFRLPPVKPDCLLPVIEVFLKN